MMIGEMACDGGDPALRGASAGPGGTPPTDPVPRGLNGARVALLEGRMGRELADLVRRHGGLPVAAPAVREVRLDASAAVGSLIDALTDGGIDMVIFLTGAGADALFAEAQRLGRFGDLHRGLLRSTNVCRGHKPRAALRRRDLPVSALVAEPYTTADVIATLDTVAPVGRGAAVVHYGERNGAIGDELRRRGNRLLDLCLYEWALPENTAPLEDLIEKIVALEVDALAFTSQVQVRHLFDIARRMNRSIELIGALNTGVVVAAVGPTCAEALEAVGVTPRVVPANPKMGPMIVALSDYLATRGRRAAQGLVAPGESLAEMVSRFEKGLIESALRATRGNRARAAKLLRTTERIVGYRVQQYEIDWRAFRE